MKTQRIIAAFACGILAALVVGCGVTDATDDPSPAAARARWNRSAVDDYEFEYTGASFCTFRASPWVRIRVEDGRVVGAVNIDDDLVYDAAALQSLFTIDGLFDILERVRERPSSTVAVSYDARLGFPVSCSIDYGSGSACDRGGFAVRNVRVL